MKKQMLVVACLCVWVAGCVPIAAADHPVEEGATWLRYPAKDANGPGAGKHVVFVVADQEYRSEQSMPMMAKILSQHHGFHCTVIFGVNEDGMVDPTVRVYPDKKNPDAFKPHNIPGLEILEKADLVIFFTRLLTLPMDQVLGLG